MKRLAIALLLAACKKEVPAPTTAAAPDLALPPQYSRGFGAGPSLPSAPSPKDQVAPTAVKLPPELASRPMPAHGFDLYVDGKLKRSYPDAALGEPATLESVTRPWWPARSFLVHGDGQELWIQAADAAAFRLRLNRRAKIKLEPVSAPGSGSNGRPGGREEQPERAVRTGEVRGVGWIELRTPASPRLSGEP